MRINIPAEWTAYMPKFRQNPDYTWVQEHQDKISERELAVHADTIIEDWSNTARANSALRLQRAVAEMDYSPDQNWIQTTTGYLQAVADSMRHMAKEPQKHFEDEEGDTLPMNECLRLAANYILDAMCEAYEDWNYLALGGKLAAI